jgi:glutathione S-transferase
MKGLASMLTLYFAPGTCALAVHIALEDAGAAYELRRVDFASGEQQGSDFQAVNPKGRVPVLATDRGLLTETPAILAWIAQTFPGAKLAPTDDPFAFARVQAFNSYLCSTVHVAHAHRLRGGRWADDPAAIEAMRKKVPVSVGACFETIESHMFEGPFVSGDAYSISDPYLFTIARWLEADGVDIQRFPKLATHFGLMAERGAVKAALEAQAA